MSDHQSAHPTIDSELDRKLAALWFMHYGDANPKAAATAIIQLKDLIAQEANKARIDELDLLGENYPPTNKFNTRLNLYIDARTIAITAEKGSSNG